MDDIVTSEIRMYPRHWRILDQVAEQNGIGRSAAIRMIVQQYPQTQQLVQLAQVAALGWLTVAPAAERLAQIGIDLPIPYRLEK